ncbi:MAG: hypothetical protein P8163_16710 [Candidatus Thiodiazotropha sp.]
MKTIFMNKRNGFAAKLLTMMQAWLISSLIFPATAFAYVDPGSGSVIVTTILGLIAAIGYTFRKYYYRVKRMIVGKNAEENRQDDE